MYQRPKFGSTSCKRRLHRCTLQPRVPFTVITSRLGFKITRAGSSAIRAKLKPRKPPVGGICGLPWHGGDLEEAVELPPQEVPLLGQLGTPRSAQDRQNVMQKLAEIREASGCGSKLHSWGYASCGLCFHMPKCHVGFMFASATPRRPKTKPRHPGCVIGNHHPRRGRPRFAHRAGERVLGLWASRGQAVRQGISKMMTVLSGKIVSGLSIRKKLNCISQSQSLPSCPKPAQNLPTKQLWGPEEEGPAPKARKYQIQSVAQAPRWCQSCKGPPQTSLRASPESPDPEDRDTA